MSITLLVPSIGRKAVLARLLGAAVRKRGGRLIGADTTPYAAGLALCDERVLLPANGDPAYWPAVDALCRRHGVTHVVPVRGGDLEDWTRRYEEPDGGGPIAGVRLLASPRETVRWCLDKCETARRLGEAGLPVVETYAGAEAPLDSISLPCVVKSRFGAGGIGMARIASREELIRRAKSGELDGMVVQPWLEGPEYSVDCYAGLNGQWRGGLARRRRSTIAGQIDTGETIHDEALLALGRRVVESFPFRGPLNVQVIRAIQGDVILEINPRFPGGIGLTVAAGMDFAECLTADALGETFALPERCREVVLLGYADGVYVPADEFRIMSGQE